jgi:hypothetical protein
MSQSHFTLSFPLQSPADVKVLAEQLPPVMPGLFQLDQRGKSPACAGGGKPQRVRRNRGAATLTTCQRRCLPAQLADMRYARRTRNW